MKRNSYLLNKFFASFLPVCIIAVMAFSLANVVDSFVASNFIGRDALAAVKIASPIFTLTIILGAILGFIVAMLAQIMPETLAMVMGALVAFTMKA